MQGHTCSRIKPGNSTFHNNIIKCKVKIYLSPLVITFKRGNKNSIWWLLLLLNQPILLLWMLSLEVYKTYCFWKLFRYKLELFFVCLMNPCFSFLEGKTCGKGRMEFTETMNLNVIVMGIFSHYNPFSFYLLPIFF